MTTTITGCGLSGANLTINWTTNVSPVAFRIHVYDNPANCTTPSGTWFNTGNTCFVGSTRSAIIDVTGHAGPYCIHLREETTAGCSDTGPLTAYVCSGITPKWKCTNPATNTCSSGTDSTYTYDTEVQCKAAANCQPTVLKWKCTNPTTNTCSSGTDSTYTYDTEALCKAAVNCQPGGGGGGVGWWDQKTCFGSTCIPNKYLAIGGGGLVLYLLLVK